MRTMVGGHQENERTIRSTQNLRSKSNGVPTAAPNTEARSTLIQKEMSGVFPKGALASLARLLRGKHLETSK
jgi:hypothetical protein